VIEPKDMRLIAGNNISIECRADGEPKPKISWIDFEGSLQSIQTSVIFFLIIQLFETREKN